MVGTQVDLEWADVPLGDTVNGGGLTFFYDAENGQLTLTEQRGGRQPFGGTVLTRIEPEASPDVDPGCVANSVVARRSSWVRSWRNLPAHVESAEPLPRSAS